MSEFIIRPVALKQILTYFEDPKNHSDDDKAHISKDEFKGAVGKISDEANAFLKEIVNSDNGYTTLRAMQTEGLFNDSEVSMRDMYAASRGYGYNGEPVKLMYESQVEFTGYEIHQNIIFDSPAFRFLDGPLSGKIVGLPNGWGDDAGTWDTNGQNIMTYEYSAEINSDGKIIESWIGVSIRSSDVKPKE